MVISVASVANLLLQYVKSGCLSGDSVSAFEYYYKIQALLAIAWILFLNDSKSFGCV